MDHVFIVNPVSGSGRYTKVLTIIQDYFSDREDSFEIRFTEYVGHATKIAAEYSSEGTILYSVGGDGTSHEIVNGLCDGVLLAIIPVGSGNDFWRMINYRGSLERIVIDTIEGKDVLIDVGLANGVRYLNCANIGLDALVNKGANEFRFKWFPRNLVYALFALKCIVTKETIDFSYEHEGEIVEHTALLASFMNGQYYGGGFRSAPLASMTDGLIDICIVKDVSRRRIISLLPKYFKGAHLDLDIVSFMQVSSFRISSASDLVFGLDGEISFASVIDVEVLPKAVSLRVPNKILIK